MKLIFDGQALRLYPFGKPGFSGGTEQYVRIIARGLARRGHTVHVVASDLDFDEQRGEREFWWPPMHHPTHASVVVAVHNLQFVPGYEAEHFILMPNGIDPWLGDDGSWGSRLSGVACFSQCHVDLLTRMRPSITPEICRVTGLGVDLSEYEDLSAKVPGRLFFSNDPTRGLWHLLDIFDEVHCQVPEATLHIGYDFDGQFRNSCWQAQAIAERLWQCKERIERGDGIVSRGALSHDELVQEQQECQVHCMPSDPQNAGSQIHGMTQLELAAAGAPLVLSNIEAFPEVFGECARLLPVPGSMSVFDNERVEWSRVTARDWADVVVELMQDRERWREASDRSREVASRHDWSVVLDRWETMLAGLTFDE